MHWRRKWHPTRVLAWRIPGTREPGGLLSTGSHRVGHDWSDLAAAYPFIYPFCNVIWTDHSPSSRSFLRLPATCFSQHLILQFLPFSQALSWYTLKFRVCLNVFFFSQLPVVMEAWLFPDSSGSSAVPLLVFVYPNPFTSLYAISSLSCQNPSSLEMCITKLLCIVHSCFCHLLVSCAPTFIHLFLVPWIFPRNMKSQYFLTTDTLYVELLWCGLEIYTSLLSCEKKCEIKMLCSLD